MERPITVLSVAQIQSLALKTLGYRSDTEVRLIHPYQDSMLVEAEIFHIALGVDYDGSWQVWSLNDAGDRNELLSHGTMPDLAPRREGQPIH